MKKLIIAAMMMIGFVGAASAQKLTDSAKGTTQKKVKTAKASTQATPATKSVSATAAKPAQTQTVVLKKDGTPDKRYSSSAKAQGPLKKDSTPDMRYKANKKH